MYACTKPYSAYFNKDANKLGFRQQFCILNNDPWTGTESTNIVTRACSINPAPECPHSRPYILVATRLSLIAFTSVINRLSNRKLTDVPVKTTDALLQEFIMSHDGHDTSERLADLNLNEVDDAQVQVQGHEHKFHMDRYLTSIEAFVAEVEATIESRRSRTGGTEDPLYQCLVRLAPKLDEYKPQIAALRNVNPDNWTIERQIAALSKIMKGIQEDMMKYFGYFDENDNWVPPEDLDRELTDNRRRQKTPPVPHYFGESSSAAGASQVQMTRSHTVVEHGGQNNGDAPENSLLAGDFHDVDLGDSDTLEHR